MMLCAVFVVAWWLILLRDGWFGLVALWYDSLCLFGVICVCFVWPNVWCCLLLVCVWWFV